jgi:hypothetical protein
MGFDDHARRGAPPLNIFVRVCRMIGYERRDRERASGV